MGLFVPSLSTLRQTDFDLYTTRCCGLPNLNPLLSRRIQAGMTEPRQYVQPIRIPPGNYNLLTLIELAFPGEYTPEQAISMIEHGFTNINGITTTTYQTSLTLNNKEILLKIGRHEVRLTT